MNAFIIGGWYDKEHIADYIKVLKRNKINVEKDWTKERGKDWEMTRKQRLNAATELLRSMEEADICWFLIPSRGGSGAWIEMGAAIYHNFSQANIPIIVSGDLWKRTIYTEFAIKGFNTHHEALRYILDEYGDPP